LTGDMITLYAGLTLRGANSGGTSGYADFWKCQFVVEYDGMMSI